MKLSVLILLFGVSFGPFLVRPLVGTLLGCNWTGVERCLVAYCPFLGILAVGGCLDAFFKSTITSDWRPYAIKASFASFLIPLMVFLVLKTRMGALEFILVNTLRALLQSLFNFYYARTILSIKLKDLLFMRKTTLMSFALFSGINTVTAQVIGSSTPMFTFVMVGNLVLMSAIVLATEDPKKFIMVL
jgi:membrane-associated HD superfamily phosphohydrolase